MNYIVAPILERVLRNYIVGLDRTSVSTSVWSGNVNLENICLNASNLNNDSSLQLPFSITKGTIGNLSLSMDWKTWYARRHPINIRVSDVVIQCSPREEDDWFRAFGAAASSTEAEDIAREKLQKSIDDIASMQEDPALMAIWAPLFASMHVELENVTIIFKDISPKREKEQTEDSDDDETKHLSEFSIRLDCLRIANPNDDDADSKSSEIASAFYSQASSVDFMETRVKSIDVTGFRVALECDCRTPRGWFPEHPFLTISSPSKEHSHEGSPSPTLIRVDNTTLLLRVSRRKKNRGFAAAIVAVNDDAIHLALTPAQLISIAHLESALKVWKKRIEYAFAKRPLNKDGKNWKEWWQYAKRAVLRGRRESKKSTPNQRGPSRKRTEAKSKDTSQRLSEIVKDAIIASSSSNTTDSDDYDDDGCSNDTDDDMDQDDDAEYAEEEEIFASLGFKSSSTLTGLHLRRRLKRGLEATASVATKLSFTTIEHMHQRGQRRQRYKRSKLNKPRQAARIKLHQQIMEHTDCVFQVGIPKLSVRLHDNFGADKCIELVYDKVYVRVNEEETLDPMESNSSDLKVVLQSFSAYVVSGDKMTEILRGKDNHKHASITLETSEGQNITSLVVAPLNVVIDSVSLELILQFAVNKVPKSSLFANRLSATLFPLCEALKLNTSSRLQTVEALLEAKEYAKKMDITLEGLSVCLVHNETREPLLCAGFDRLTSTSGGVVRDENDEINVFVGRDTYMNDLLESAKDIGDIASLNELENLVGTMKSSFSVDNMCIGTNISGDKTFILNGWSAAIISEKNTVNRTQRLAVQRFDPISLSILPSDVKSLAMLFDIFSRMQVNKMDVSNWRSDKLFKVSAMIAPPITLDARVSLPDIDLEILDVNGNGKYIDEEPDFWLRVKVKGLAFDAASTTIKEEPIAWSTVKIESFSVLCESNTIAATVSNISISRAERRDENVYVHADIGGIEVDASLYDCVAMIRKFSSATTETQSDSNRESFSLQSQHAPSSHALEAPNMRWSDLPTRRVLLIDDVPPCVDYVARAVLEVTDSKSIVTGKLERISVVSSLFEHKNAGSISMNIPGGVELRTVPVSITSEAYVKMNEINLAFTTEDGYHQSASISRVNVMASADFRTFSGQWSVTVPWQFEAMSNVIIADFDASVDLSTGVDVVIDEFYVCAGKSKYGAQEAIRMLRTSSRLLEVKSIHIERRQDPDDLEVNVAHIDARLTSTHISIVDSFIKNVVSELDRVCRRGVVLPSADKDRPLSSLSSASSSSLISERSMETNPSRTENSEGDNTNFVKNLPDSTKLGIRRISVRIDDDRYSMEHPVPVSFASLTNTYVNCTKRSKDSLEANHINHTMKENKVIPLSLSVSFQVCGGTYDTLKRNWEFAFEPVALKSSVETGNKSFILTTSSIDFVVRKTILESLAVSNAIVNCDSLRSASRARDTRAVEPFQCFWLKNSSGVDLSYEFLTNMDTSLGGTCISNGEVAVRYGDSWKDDASEYLERLGDGDLSSLAPPLGMSNEYGYERSGLSLFRLPTVIGLKIRLTNAPESRHYLSLADLESKAWKCEALPKSVWGGTEGDSCSLVAEIRCRENAVEQREVVLRSNVVVQNSTLKPVVLSFAGKSTFGPIEAGEYKYLPLSLASLDSFVWKFEGEGAFSLLPSDEISLHSVDSFIPVNARRCAIVISSDEESVTRTIAFVAPLELRNHLPVPIKASFLSGNRKFSSFVVAPRSTAIIEESEDVLDAATLSFVPLGYVCARSSIYIPTFSNLSRRQNPLKVFRHTSPSIRRNTNDRSDEDVTTLECSVYLDKNTSSRVVSIACAMTLTNLTTQSLTLKYADMKSITSGKYNDRLGSLDESSANTVVCPPTPPSTSVNEMGRIGTTEKAFEHTAASDLSSKAVLFNRMHSTSFSSSDLESSFTSTPVRANLSARFQTPSPNAFGVSSAGVSSHLSRFSSDSAPYALPSSSSGGKILAMKNSTQYPRILGDSRRHRRDSGFGLFTLGCEEYASDPFELAPASGKFKIVHVKPYYSYVITTIYEDSDGGCAHIFVRPKGTITNSTDEIVAFKESDFEESDGIILLPGQTAHVRSKKPANSTTKDNAREGERKEESAEESEDAPRVRIRPASSAQERWNWSDEITASTAWCRCTRALSLDRTKDDVHFSVQFNESEEDGCYNIDVIAGKHFVNQDGDDIDDEEEELPGVKGFFQTSPPPKFVVSPLKKPSSSSKIPVSHLLSSPVSKSSATASSSLSWRTKPFFLESFQIKVASIGLSAQHEKTELVNGRVHGISVMLSENCKDEDEPDPLVQGHLIVERIDICTSSSSEENESSIILSVPNAEMRTANIGATYFTAARNAITLTLSGRVFSRHVTRSGARVDVDVAPVRIDLQESLLKKVPGFVAVCVQSLDVLEKPKLETRLKMERNRKVKSKSFKAIEDAALFRIDKLSISDVPIVLSFTELPFVPFLFSKLAAVERAKITLSGFKNQKALAFPDEVLKALERHVKNQAVGRIRDLIKHNALLGDPARLVESTRHAVHELGEGNGLKAFARVTSAFGRSGVTTLNRIKSIADGWVEEFDSLENERRRGVRDRHIMSLPSSSINVVDGNVLPTRYSERVVGSVCKAVMDIIQNPITGLECRGLVGMAEGSIFGAVSGISRILAAFIEGPLSLANTFLGE